MSQTVEIIKAIAELLKPISWPGTIVAIVWILREPFGGLSPELK